MNMMTDERQHAYKPNKSTIDVIYNIKSLVKQYGRILLDLPKAFGRIDRGGLCDILYGKGIPIKLTHQIKKWTH